MTAYGVTLTGRTVKNINRLPRKVQEKFALLLGDLRDMGPVQPGWRNYSKLARDTYHCHLTHKYVACWRNKKGVLTVEVYYAGSREDAPY